MKKAFFFFLLACVVLAGVFKWFNRSSFLHLSPPEILGGVVQTDSEKGGRLYYLTSQWETRVIYTGRRISIDKKTVGWVNIDLWEFDVTTAQPLSRRRIKREKVNGDFKALGLEQGILWARIPELVGIRLADGVVVADRAKIVTRNPGLAGLLPKPPEAATFLTESMQPLKFDPSAGIIVMLDDARRVRIDPLTLEATPYIAPESEKKEPQLNAAVDPRKKLISVSYGTDWNAMVRGLSKLGSKGGGEWLGLLSEPDLEVMREGKKNLTLQMDFSVPSRSRLYRAELKEHEGFFGHALKYLNPNALPECPEFLMAGLLTREAIDGVRDPTALLGREPDSVFVLSRDRLGDEGRLQMARISYPKGTPMWSIALPLSKMSAWIPGERYAVMLGPNPSAQRSPMAEERDNPIIQILSIDLTTGALQSFNPDLHRNWPVEEFSEKTK